MMTSIECPSHQQLRALTLGQLSSEDSDVLFQHIAECNLCRSELETVEDGGDSLIVSLRDPVKHSEYSAESDCRLAVVKALGALAIPDSSVAHAGFESLPSTIGEYEILRPIGSGGMGNVFLARHTKLGREVALKVLASHRLADTRMLERFEAEMRAVGRLSHPNIVTAHDAREVDGTAVLITEYVTGLDLGQLLQRTGALSISDACEIARQIAVALTYTNSQGFVHRDVKPSNVMLSADGEVKLLDLGLARLQYGEHERTEITGTGQTMGTADYVAPEQVTDSKTVDIRADIYSLGCTLFKLLAGRAPFADDQHITTFAKMTAHVSKKPPSLGRMLPSAPRVLVQFVDSMLAKKPADRPATPQDVALALAPHCKDHNLEKLIGEALVLEPRKQGTASTSTIAKPATQHWMKRTVPFPVAIAAGLLGVLLGICLSIIIVISNPDGTRTLIQLAEGSKVEVRETNRNGSNDAITAPLNDAATGQTANPNVADSDVTPLSFGILVNRESTGHSPSANESQILEATRLLRTSDGSQPVRTPVGTWYAIADDEMGAPIKELNAGKYFVLVSDQQAIRWPRIHGHVLTFQTNGSQTNGDRSFWKGDRVTAINLRLDRELGGLFAKLTKPNIRNQLAIIVNGQVRSAPIINSEIGEQISITGSFDSTEAKQLSQWLHGGLVDPLPNATADPDASQKPYIKTYQLTQSQIEPQLAYDVLSMVLAGKPNVRLAVDEPNRQLILLASPAEHELIEKTLAELTRANEQRTEEKQQLATGLKQQLLELEQEYDELLNRYGEGHPAAKNTLRRIELVKEQILQIEVPEADTAAKKLVELQNKLRQIGLSFHNFESSFKKFPGTSNTPESSSLPTRESSSQSADVNENHPFSWRVAILPFLGHHDLYQQFHLDEPWDSEHNLKLLDKMPAIYRSPFAEPDQKVGEANILGFARENSALGIGGGEKLNSFTDGIANTLLLVETTSTVPWTKPEDIQGDASQVRFFSDHPITVLMADGAVKTIASLPDEVLEEMISRNGGSLDASTNAPAN